MADMYLGRREELEAREKAHQGNSHRDEPARNGTEPASKSPRESRIAHPHDIEDCENLLENYFMQVQLTCLGRLS